MDVILSQVKRQIVLVHFVNIIIHSSPPEKQISYKQIVLLYLNRPEWNWTLKQ